MQEGREVVALYKGFGDRSDFSGGLTWTLKGLGLGDRAR